jgi:nucleotide-binding universal stress UspA family protein
MTAIRRLLCATDLSPASQPAWDEARLLARLLGAEVMLLHVVSPMPLQLEGYFPPPLYLELVEGARRKARADLDAQLARAGGPGVKARGRVADGIPAERIVDVAREEGSDLLVVGTRGRTGLERVLLGSVADRVVRTASRPVVTVRSQPPAARPGLARILYATDFSPTARAAWPWVLALAEPTAAAVDLLHVTLQAVPDRDLPPEILARMTRALEEHGQTEAERFLQESERRWPGRLPRARVQVHVGAGVAGDQIAHQAQARDADLIVMGTHGWSGLVRWMLGSVAQHVIQIAPCPVLTLGPEAQGGQALTS